MVTKCIFIGGYGRSGSTLLDSILSNIDGVNGIGEASNLFDALITEEKCSCQKKIDQCDFWSGILSQSPPEKYSCLAHEQRRSENILTGLLYDGRHYKKFWIEFWNKMKLSNTTIVDSSKISRATFFRPLNFKKMGVNVTIVHLYKDPSLLLASLMKGSNKHLSKNTALSKTPHFFLMRSFFGALFSNTATYLIGKLCADKYIKINFSELLLTPELVVGSLVFNSNRPPIDYYNIKVGHGVSGNRMRKGSKEIKLDKSKIEAPSSSNPYFYQLLYNTLKVFES